MVATVHAIEIGQQLHTVVCVNAHIFVLKCAQNDAELVSRIDLAALTVEGAAINQQKSKKDGAEGDKLAILSSDVSPDHRFLAVATTTKHLFLLGVDSVLKCGTNGTYEDAKWQPIPKTPTAVHFSACGQTLLVSTRSGSLLEYRLTTGAVNFCPSSPTELLSHFSMLLDHCLSPGRPKFLLSADRDEKVRVSRYPNTKVIECFCLGHSSFVNSVCCLDDEIAISGGGDGVLRVWQFKNGRCLCVSPKLNSFPVRKVLPFCEKNKIVVLFDGSSQISLFHFDPRRPSIELSRTLVGICQLFDFAVDAKCQQIFAVGSKGLFCCYFGDVLGTEFTMMNLGGDSVSSLLTELSNLNEPFPLEQLYKAAAFGNLENYERKKEERRKRRRTETQQEKEEEAGTEQDKEQGDMDETGTQLDKEENGMETTGTEMFLI